MQITKIDLRKYKKYWKEEALRSEVKKEKLRKDALKTAERLKDILIKNFSVKKIVIFGSVLQKGDFDENSDIDLAVEGLPKNAFFTALARLIMESPFEVDLKPIEDTSDLLRKRISQGKILYEKRNDS
ncbi:MAG: nucleotidyltransferase domain-containing protein [Nitrospirae bacterium]|nr:nucleotidyltransferase domain-containing protein [Nitrospirota bacterium]